MPQVFPFSPLQYAHGRGDVSAVIAPPYDVLGEPDKAALLERDGHNIVAVDLPHVPPKELGPKGAYETAAATLGRWIETGVLAQQEPPAIFAYRQSFEFLGKAYQRCGMACTVETMPFGPRRGAGFCRTNRRSAAPRKTASR